MKQAANLLSKTGKSLGANTGTVTTAVYNTIAEAGMEASEIRKQIYEEARHKGQTHEQATQTAAEAAKRTFWYNTLALMGPNFLQTKWMGFGSKDRSQVRKLIRETGEKTEDVIKKYAPS